jgi:hypothetical protein
MSPLRFALIFLFLSGLAWAEPQMEKHRIQATTTKDEASGWYVAESTRGAFSVLIPIPFNDITATADDPKLGKIHSYIIGSKSAEGIKFSATEVPVVPGMPDNDITQMADRFKKPGQTVSDVDTAPYDGNPSISLSIVGPTSGAFMRYVKTPQSMIIMVLEYPLVQKKAAQGMSKTFLSSLKIKKVAGEKKD